MVSRRMPFLKEPIQSMITRIEPWLLFLVITAALTFFARADLDAEKGSQIRLVRRPRFHRREGA